MSGSGIAKVMADVIRGDIISLPASTWSSNPKYNSFFSGQPSAVPYHFYTCARDIWLLNSTASSEIGNWSIIVNDSYGIGTSSSRSIDVIPIRVMDQVDAPGDQGPRSNATGAEFAEVHVIFKLPDGLTAPVDTNRIFEMASRIERILDWNYGLNTTKKAPLIPSTDINIRNDCNIQCYYKGMVNPIDSKLVHLIFHCFYTRLFLA